MKLRSILLTALSVSMAAAHSLYGDEQPGHQVAAELKAKISVEMKYLLYLPKEYDQQDSWPLMLFLHGAGERGDDLELVKKHGPPKLIATGKDFPFVVVSPLCPSGKSWEPMELMALLDEISRKYKVDPDRIVVTGISMGGFGTWRLAAYAADRLAAIAPICGGGEPYTTRQFAHLPVWAFHGAKDTAVAIERSQAMVDALKKNGGDPKFTIYPDARHDSWTETYDNPALYEWLLAQKRTSKD